MRTSLNGHNGLKIRSIEELLWPSHLIHYFLAFEWTPKEREGGKLFLRTSRCKLGGLSLMSVHFVYSVVVVVLFFYSVVVYLRSKTIFESV